jgi:hypothetical protein
MARISKLPVERNDGKASLLPRHVIVVRVASFAFRFESIERLRECIKYYERKTRPSSRIAAKTLSAALGEDWRKLRGWDVERWLNVSRRICSKSPNVRKCSKRCPKL